MALPFAAKQRKSRGYSDNPALETVAAVAILRDRLPALRIRVVNVVDLMRLEPDTEHPHGLPDAQFDALMR